MKGVCALQNMVSGIDLGKLSSSTPSLSCEGCIEGKLHMVAFPNDGRRRASKHLEIVHLDVCRPMKITFIGRVKYFVTFIDDYSRKVWVYILMFKEECFERFKEYKALVETQSEHKIKVLRSDNRREFISKAFEDFLKAHEIEKQTSTPYTLQQNGVAERLNCTIVEMARSMIYEQHMKLEFWAEAVVNAVYVRNRCPTRALTSITPEEAWSGRKPCISHLRVFGCITYTKIPDQKRSKFDSKGTKCLFLEYCVGTKAYRFIDVKSKKIIKSRDVVFDEDASGDLEMCPSGSNDTTIVIGVDTCSKLYSKEDCDEDGGTQDTKEEVEEEQESNISNESPSLSKEEEVQESSNANGGTSTLR